MRNIVPMVIATTIGCFIALALFSLIDVRGLWSVAVERYRDLTATATLSERFCELMGESLYQIGGENGYLSVETINGFVASLAKHSSEKGNRYAYTDAKEIFFDAKIYQATGSVPSSQGMRLYVNTCINMTHREAERLQAKRSK